MYLKFAMTKPEPFRSNLKANAREIMEKNRTIPRRNFNYIEYVLRTEINKLETLKKAGGLMRVTKIGGSAKMEDPDALNNK